MNDIKSDDKLFSEFPQITKDEWIEKIKADLKGADFEKKLVWKFDEDLKFQPFYMAEDLPGIPVPAKSGDDNNWEIRDEIDIKDISKAGDLINRGADALIVKGMDLQNKKHFENLIANVDITRIPVHFTGISNYKKLLEHLKEIAKSNGIDTKQIKGSLNFDFYGYYLLNGEFYDSHKSNIEETVDLFDYAVSNFPQMRLLNINADIYHNSGATIIEEMAFALAHGAEYLTDLTDAGIDIMEILPRMQFTFATGSSYFPEIAKIRALRFLWQQIIAKFADNKNVNDSMYIHSVSSSWDKAVYDPYVNLLRTTTETMSAIIGGSDAVTVLPLDIFYRKPQEVSKRIARNQQIILKEEVNLRKVIDPAKGSYYIENLTAGFIEKAWGIFLNINNIGGFKESLESGFIFDKVEKSANKKDMDIAIRKINLLGVNQFPNINEEMLQEIENREIKRKGNGLKPYRGAEPFENLRLKTEKYCAAGNKKPLVFLLTHGNLAMRKARANFALNFFGCAGFNIMDNNGFDTAAEGMKAASDAKADLVVLCSSDEEYLPLVEEIESDKSKIVIAGYPLETIEKIKAAGVDKFIHAKSNVLQELDFYQKLLGIK